MHFRGAACRAEMRSTLPTGARSGAYRLKPGGEVVVVCGAVIVRGCVDESSENWREGVENAENDDDEIIGLLD